MSAIQSRSIGKSISTAVSASAGIIESTALAVDTIVSDLPKGITRLSNTLSTTLDVTDLYLINWKEDKTLSLIESRIERNVKLEKIKQELDKVNLSYDEMIKPISL